MNNSLNLMTEDEAKTKWCPAVRFAPWTGSGSGMVDNRGDPFDPMRVPCCVASDCMAWRAHKEMFRNTTTGKLTDFDNSGHGKWIKLGYCGLVGNQ
jgi:hypothetical protein